MDLSASLENILDSLAKEGITKATAMSASDKVNKYELMLRNSIARYSNFCEHHLGNFLTHLSSRQKLSKQSFSFGLKHSKGRYFNYVCTKWYLVGWQIANKRAIKVAGSCNKIGKYGP